MSEFPNPIQKLKNRIASVHPDAILELDPGPKQISTWFLDCHYNSKYFIIGWNIKYGFGIAAYLPSTFEKFDEIFDNEDDIFNRVLELLTQEYS